MVWVKRSPVWLLLGWFAVAGFVSGHVRASDIVVQTAEQSGWLGGASAMAVAADGVTVAMGDSTGNISFWDLSRRQRLGQFRAVQDQLNGVRGLQWFGGRDSVLVTSDQSFAIWNRFRDQVVFEQPRAIRFGDPGLFDLAVSRNSAWIAMSAWSEAALIDSDSNGPDRIRPLPMAAGARLALDDEGRKLAVFGYDGLRLYEVADLNLKWHAPGQAPFDPGQMQFSADGSWLLIQPGGFAAKVASLYATSTGERTELPSGIKRWQFLSDNHLLGLDEQGCWQIWSAGQGPDPSPAACRHDGRSAFAVLRDDAVFAARRIFDAGSGVIIGELSVSPRRFELARVDENRGMVTIAVSPDLTDPDLMAWRDRKPARRYLGPGLYQWDLSTGEQQPLPYREWLVWNARNWPGWCEPVHDPSVSYRWLSESDDLWLGLSDRIVRCTQGRVETVVQNLEAPLTWLRVRQSGPAQLLMTADRQGALSVYSIPDDRTQAELVQRHLFASQGTQVTGLGHASSLDLLMDLQFRTGEDSPWIVMRDAVINPAGTRVFEGWIESLDREGDDLALGTDQGIALLNLKHGEVRQWLDTGKVAPVSIRQETRHIFALMPDGALRIFDRASGEWIVSAYRVGEQGSALVTPQGEYAASRTAVSALTRVSEAGLLEFSAFDLQRNRPDRVLANLGYASDSHIQFLRALHDRRIRRLGSQAPLAMDTQPLAWASPVPLQTTLPEQILNIEVPTSGRLQVSVSGVEVTPDGGIAVESGVARVPISLVPGDNRVSVMFQGSSGVRLPALSAFVYLRKPPVAPMTYLLGVGVSSYAQSQYDLRYAAKDIQDVARYFQVALGSEVKTHLLLDHQATRRAILQARDFLAQARIEDRVILYFAGHGLLSDQGQFYFAPSDMDFADPATSGLSFEQIEGLLGATTARERLIFLDSCHAGQNDEAFVGLDPVPAFLSDDARDQVRVTARGLRRVSKIPENAPVLQRPLLEDVFVDLQVGSGAHVIAAAGAAEFALESARWSNGVFTASVLEGLSTRAADLDYDRRIEVDELRRFVAARVAELTQGRQMPTARSVNHALPVVLAEAVEPTGMDWSKAPAALVMSDDAGSTLAYDPTGRFLVMADGRRVVRLDLDTGKHYQIDWSIAWVNGVVVSPGAQYAVAQVEASGRFASDRLLYWIDFEENSVTPLASLGLAKQLFRPSLTGAFTADAQWFVIEGDFPDRGLLVVPSKDLSQWRREPLRTRGFLDAIAGVVDARIRLVDEYGEVIELDVANGKVIDRWMLSVPLRQRHATTEFMSTPVVALSSYARYFARSYQRKSGQGMFEHVLGVWDLQTKRQLSDRVLDERLPVRESESDVDDGLESYLRPALLSLQVTDHPVMAMLDGASIRVFDPWTEVETGWAYRGSMRSTLPWVLAPNGRQIVGINASGQLVSWEVRGPVTSKAPALVSGQQDTSE